jgi:two-component system cell cycle response regulator
LAVTISVGVAAAIAGGDHRDRLLKRADDALYSAKSGGRNRVIVRSADI